MKRIVYLIFAVLIVVSSCTKSNNNPAPPTIPLYVTINGTNYRTVVINNQLWTGINYNGPGGWNYAVGANDTTKGKLYTWAEAKAVTLPSGWRLPTHADYTNLQIAVGAQQQPDGSYMTVGSEPLELMSTTGWSATNGNDNVGFSAQPAGYYTQVSGGFNGLGTAAVFLTATPYAAGAAYPFTFEISATSAQFTNIVTLPTDRASVRFVTDSY